MLSSNIDYNSRTLCSARTEKEQEKLCFTSFYPPILTTSLAHYSARREKGGREPMFYIIISSNTDYKSRTLSGTERKRARETIFYIILSSFYPLTTNLALSIQSFILPQMGVFFLYLPSIFQIL